MADTVDKQTRSRMMAGIKGKNTKPELAIRRTLHAYGFRFRLHPKEIYGRPDLVLPKHHAVIFVHGCFWHRHEGCRHASTPATRSEFWQAKFARNVARDNMVRKKLLTAGWRLAIVWGCALQNPNQALSTGKLLATWLLSNRRQIDIGMEIVKLS